ncbi:unnamed protein product [Ectocarpus sp. 12 AP-2014]
MFSGRLLSGDKSGGDPCRLRGSFAVPVPGAEIFLSLPRREPAKVPAKNAHPRQSVLPLHTTSPTMRRGRPRNVSQHERTRTVRRWGPRRFDGNRNSTYKAGRLSAKVDCVHTTISRPNHDEEAGTDSRERCNASRTRWATGAK